MLEWAYTDDAENRKRMRESADGGGRRFREKKEFMR